MALECKHNYTGSTGNRTKGNGWYCNYKTRCDFTGTATTKNGVKGYNIKREIYISYTASQATSGVYLDLYNSSGGTINRATSVGTSGTTTKYTTDYGFYAEGAVFNNTTVISARLMIEGIWGSYSTLNISGNLFTVPVNTSACSAPSTFTVKLVSGSDSINLPTYITPSQSLKIQWSGASSGVNNSIASYTIFVNGNSYKTITSTATSGSVTYKVSDLGLSRGDEISIGIRTNGSAGSSFYSSINTFSTKPKINRLPSAPTISNNTIQISSTTTSYSFTDSLVTKGTDSDSGQTVTTYYATSTSGSKARLPYSKTFNEGVYGEQYLYLWSYDGLEYSSSYVTVKLEHRATPTFSVEESFSNYGNSIWTYKLDSTIQTSNPDGIITAKLYWDGALKRTTTRNVESEKSTISFTPFSINEIIENLKGDEGLSSLKTHHWYVTYQYKDKMDAIGKVSGTTNTTYNGRNADFASTASNSNNPTLYNNYDNSGLFNVDTTTSNIFSSKLGLSFVYNPIMALTSITIGNYIIPSTSYSILNNGAEGKIKINLQGLSFADNGSYQIKLVWSNTTYGITSTIIKESKKVNKYSIFSNIANPVTLKPFGVTKTTSTFDLGMKSTINSDCAIGYSTLEDAYINGGVKFFLTYNNSEKEITSVFSLNQIVNENTARFTLTTSNNSLYNLLNNFFTDKNINYSCGLRAKVTNLFGDAYEFSNLATINIDYREDVTIDSIAVTFGGLNSFYIIQPEDATKVLKFITSFKTYNVGDAYSCEIQRQIGSGAFSTLVAASAVSVSGTPGYGTPVTITCEKTYSIREEISSATTWKFKTVIKKGSSSYSKDSSAFNTLMAKTGSSTLSATYTDPNAMGTYSIASGITSSVPSTYGRNISYEISTSPDFTSIDGGSGTLTSLSSSFTKKITLASWDYLYVRIKVEEWVLSATSGGFKSVTKSFYSPTVTIYNISPLVAYRNKYLGINTNTFEATDILAMAVRDNNRYIIRMINEDNVMVVNIKTGEIDGFVLDGGSW